MRPPVAAALLLLAACEAPRDPAAAPAPLEAAAILTADGPAGAYRTVRCYDEWSRIPLAGATVTCLETGEVARTDTSGTALLRAPAGPATLTGWAPGYGLATVVGATTARVGLPLPDLTPRTIAVRGTVGNIVATTGSHAEVPNGLGGPDPMLASSPTDTYQLTMRAARNFRVTILEIGPSGLSNLACSPFQWKLAPHKSATIVDFGFPSFPPTLSTCSGSCALPGGFTAATVEVRGRAVLAGEEPLGGEGTVVGFGAPASPFASYTLDYPGTVLTALGATELVVDGVARAASGAFTRTRVPHVATSTGQFPSALTLVFPAVCTPASPPNATAGVSRTPTLAWTGGTPAGAGADRVRLRDLASGRLWDVWIPGGAGTVTLPALPAALAPQGLAVGATVLWSVRGFHCPAFAWTDASLARLDRDGTGESEGAPFTFVP